MQVLQGWRSVLEFTVGDSSSVLHDPRLRGAHMIAWRRPGSNSSSRRLSPFKIGVTQVLPKLACHDHMPVVLDCVVCAAREETRNHGPFVAVEAMRGEKALLLVVGEGATVDAWV